MLPHDANEDHETMAGDIFTGPTGRRVLETVSVGICRGKSTIVLVTKNPLIDVAIPIIFAKPHEVANRAIIPNKPSSPKNNSPDVIAMKVMLQIFQSSWKSHGICGVDG